MKCGRRVHTASTSAANDVETSDRMFAIEYYSSNCTCDALTSSIAIEADVGA